MLFLVLAPLILTLGAALTVYSWWTLRTGIRNTREELDEMAENHAGEIRSKIDEIVRQVGVIADTLRTPSAKASSYLENALGTIPAIQALVIAYDPEFLKKLQKGEFSGYELENHFNQLKGNKIPDHYCPLVYRGLKTRFLYTNFNDECYMYRDWYHLARISGKSIWSDPFFGDLTHTRVCAYAIPFYFKGNFAGVLSAFVKVDELFSNADLEAFFAKKNYRGNFFILAGNGKFIYHTIKGHISRHNIYSFLSELERKDLFPKMDQFFNGLNDSFRIENFQLFPSEDGTAKNRQAIWFVCTPIRDNTDYTLVVTFNEEELFFQLYKKLAYIWGGGILFIFLLSALVVNGFRRIFSPLGEISRVANLVSQGNLDVKAKNPFGEKKGEIANLFKNFNAMVDSLKVQITKIREEQGQRIIMEGNLRAAREIQGTFLPDKLSFFKDKSFHLDAVLIPAREVAGDFFDFWKVDDDTIAIAVGDVSGKGITAAMIMVAVKTMIRLFKHNYHSPAEIVSEVNQALEMGNKTKMFLTLFMAFYNFRTGEIRCTNAGHNPPQVLQKDGTLSEFRTTQQPLVGVMKASTYFTETSHLNPGDTLFVHTDGVIDLTNKQGERFGVDRFKELLYSLREENVHEYIPIMINVFQNFSAPDQKDDITILCLHRS